MNGSPVACVGPVPRSFRRRGYVSRMDAPRTQLVLLQGGRKDEEGQAGGAPLPREALRVIEGGPAGDLQAALEETVQAARRMREEIEARIAKALEELF